MTALASSIKNDLNEIFIALNTDTRPDEGAIERLFELEERLSAVVYDVNNPQVLQASSELASVYKVYALGLILADEISEAHFLLSSRLPDVVKSDGSNNGIDIICELVEALEEGDYRAIYGIQSRKWPEDSHEKRLFDRFLDKYRHDMLDQILGAYARIPRQTLQEYLGLSGTVHLDSILSQGSSKGVICEDPADNNFFICKKNQVIQPPKRPLSINQQADLTIDLQ